jgi:hypothetical protein
MSLTAAADSVRAWRSLPGSLSASHTHFDRKLGPVIGDEGRGGGEGAEELEQPAVKWPNANGATRLPVSSPMKNPGALGG